MHTLTVDPELSSDESSTARAMRDASVLPNASAPPSSETQAQAVAPLDAGTERSASAELDAMLEEDPNTGAIHGLRMAMLFNAGLALTGLVGWEIWTCLSR